MDVLAMWLLYAAFGVSVFSLLFVWAVRNRQFTDQDRARHMALHSPEQEPPGPAEGE
ncbi:MAG: cbb3-type cytochrome oxidase assembly protein [Armatimonadota bacterium]